MSHLARELARQLVWIEQQARELQAAVEQLIGETNVLNDSELWNETQADIIRSAINDHADNCGRYIANACPEVSDFRKQLVRAQY